MYIIRCQLANSIRIIKLQSTAAVERHHTNYRMEPTRGQNDVASNKAEVYAER